MKATELQIGNLIYRPCCVDKVAEIRENGIIGTDKLRGIIPFSEIEPIQITEEWLEKNGFKLNFDVMIASACEVYELSNDEYNIEIRKESNTDSREYFCHIDNQDCQGIACADVQYIHQIQNLLNLVGVKSDFKV